MLELFFVVSLGALLITMLFGRSRRAEPQVQYVVVRDLSENDNGGSGGIFLLLFVVIAVIVASAV